MTTVIYKYHLEPGLTDVALPYDFKVLDVQLQGANVVAWIILDPNAPLVKAISFETIPTGIPVEHELGEYVGTFQIPRESLVFHVFWREVFES